MRTITQPARTLDVVDQVDVLVVGSGPGGLGAALGAARAGVEMMVVERFGCLGGNITVVGVESLAWYRREKTVDSVGIGVEFEQRAKAMGATSPEVQSKSEAIDADMFKVVADRVIAEAGVRPLLHAVAIDTIMEGDALRGIIVHSKSGRGAILAKRIVDATGDADVACFAGAPYHMTPKERMLPVTVMFSVSRRRQAALPRSRGRKPHHLQGLGPGTGTCRRGQRGRSLQPVPRKPFARARAEGVIPAGLQDASAAPGARSTTPASSTYLNVIHLDRLRRAPTRESHPVEIEGRRRRMQAIKAMSRYTPGCEQGHSCATSG